MSTFSPARIRQARLSASFSRMDLAHRAGTSEKNIARWENGKHTPRLEHVAAIAEATGRDVSFFLASSDEEDEEADLDLDGATMKAAVDLVRALRRGRVA